MKIGDEILLFMARAGAGRSMLNEREYPNDGRGTPKFTPGKWVCHLTNNDGCQCTSVLADGYCGSVAQISLSNDMLGIAGGGNDSPPLEEAKANARLITAAPDMYRALRELVDFINDTDFLLPQAKYNEVVSAIAALNKAEGRQ